MLTFPKTNRLLKKSEFDFVKSSGKRSQTRFLIRLMAKNDLNHPRLGVIVTKKIGNAVVRNICKRSIRDYFRKAFRELDAGDHVIIVKHATHSIPKHDIRKTLMGDLGTVFKKNGISNT